MLLFRLRIYSAYEVELGLESTAIADIYMVQCVNEVGAGFP